jgi:hypothetical protein
VKDTIFDVCRFLFFSINFSVYFNEYVVEASTSLYHWFLHAFW